MMLDLKRRSENVKAEYTLNHTSGNGFGFEEQHAMRHWFIIVQGVSITRLDDDVFENEYDAGGGGQAKKRRIILSTAPHKPWSISSSRRKQPRRETE